MQEFDLTTMWLVISSALEIRDKRLCKNEYTD